LKEIRIGYFKGRKREIAFCEKGFYCFKIEKRQRAFKRRKYEITQMTAVLQLVVIV
jgi:hypothetical protein